MALLIGFALDQQVPVQKAFSGPKVLLERLGTHRRRAARARSTRHELEAASKGPPAIHRFPGAMAKRVHELATYIAKTYDGDAARLWTDASDARDLKRRIAALPGFGEMKVASLTAVLTKRLGVRPGWLGGGAAVAPDPRRRRLGRRRSPSLPGDEARHEERRCAQPRGDASGGPWARPMTCAPDVTPIAPLVVVLVVVPWSVLMRRGRASTA